MQVSAFSSLAGGEPADPDRPAVVLSANGTIRTFAELEQASNRVAMMLRSAGCARGDVVAVLLENRAEVFEIAWAAQRSGLYYTMINHHLADHEVTYILENSGAKVLVVSSLTSDRLRTATALDHVDLIIDVDLAEHADGISSYSQACDAQIGQLTGDEPQGCELLYSSGTTGRPKAIRRPLPPAGAPVPTHAHAVSFWRDRYDMTSGDVYLSPGPLYHAAPLMTCLTAHRLGATVVVMERFDAETTLRLIDEYNVTHAQFVPTMFIRMLKLDPGVRTHFDMSSLRSVVHAAAPCPVDVKRAMIDWFGPIVHEYYGGTEAIGTTLISSEEWMLHPGSVGRPIGCAVHVVGDDGAELPVGCTGGVYFESDAEFEYLGDVEKTASITDDHGWRTLGDVGHVDEDGYLFLTDRATFMIVSGGVNIYPQEVENVLVAHPAVLDAAVFGVPNDDFGEEVKAVVELRENPDSTVPTPTPSELIEFCRDRIAHFKCPRSLDIVNELPRDPNGKLYKRRLRDAYWPIDKVST